MTKAMPFLQKAILLSYDPRRLSGAAFRRIVHIFVISVPWIKSEKTRNSGCFTDLIRHMHPHYPFALMHRSAAETKAAIASARDARVRLQASA